MDLTANKGRISTILGYQRFIAHKLHCKTTDIVIDSYISEYSNIEINTDKLFATGTIVENEIFLVGYYRGNGCPRFEIRTRR